MYMYVSLSYDKVYYTCIHVIHKLYIPLVDDGCVGSVRSADTLCHVR